MGAASQYFRHIRNAVVTVFDGMAVSASHLLRRPYTIQYPDRTPVRVQDTLPFRYRGILDVDLRSARDAWHANALARSIASRSYARRMRRRAS